MSLFTQTAKVTGVIKANGTSSSGVVSNLSTNRPVVGVYGSTVVDNNDVDSVVAGGILGYNNQRPVAKKITTQLNIADNTYLLSGAAVPSLRRNVMSIDTVKTRQFATSLREGKYNIFTNTFSSTCGDGNDSCPDVVTDYFEEDTAATVGVNNKGNLVYTLGRTEPVVQEYDPQ